MERGEKIGVYQAVLTEHFDDSDPPEYTFDSLAFTTLRESVWFDGRLLSEGGNPVLSDRLGTNRAGSAKFTAYGEEMGTSTSNDRTKFGTYNRDGFTGLDYADQRFYASSYGRFNSPDPYSAEEGGTDDPSDPGSWNSYAYVGGDPANFYDPEGLFKKKPQPGNPSPPLGGVSGSGKKTPVQPNPDRGGKHPSAGSGGADVVKEYDSSTLCPEGASGLIQHLEANFSQFASYSGSFGALGLATGTVVFGSGPLTLGRTVSIGSVVTAPVLPPQVVNTSVTVTSLTSTSFTFTTVPGHVLFPATITFAAMNAYVGSNVNFSIKINGDFASATDEAKYYLGGSDFEDGIWSHLLNTAAADCGKVKP